MKYETLLPQLVWNSTSVVDVDIRAASLDAFTAITLSDGKRRSYSGSLSVDKTTSGHGGLYATPVSNSQWYQFFLVPATGDDDSLEVIASTANASAGPESGEAFRYIGSNRTDGSGLWFEFVYRGPVYHFTRIDQMIKIKHLQNMVADTWYKFDYGALEHAPVGVVSVMYVAAGSNATSHANTSGVYASSSDGGDPWTLSATIKEGHQFIRTGASGAGGHSSQGNVEVPFRSGDTTLCLGADDTYNLVSAGLRAFTNKYLEE